MVCNGYCVKEYLKDSVCIEFFAKYVSLLFTKNTIRKWLEAHPDLTFLCMVTPSDIAFVATLIKNSQNVWQLDPAKDDGAEKPLFTSDVKKKREFSGNAWNEDGMQYYNKSKKSWHHALNNRETLQLCTKLQENFLHYIEENPEYAHLNQKKKMHKYDADKCIPSVASRTSTNHLFQWGRCGGRR